MGDHLMPAFRDPSTGRFVSTGGGDPFTGRTAASDVTINWFDRQVRRNISIGMTARLKLAAQLVRDRTVINISRPVTKLKGTNGRIVVDPASRSKPGEFPKADTTRLMKDIFWQMNSANSAMVGTTLDYGLFLETRMNRSFLRRTLNEMLPTVRRMLTTDAGRRLPGQEP
jgi:hypothetical protein